jgi:dihydrofolate reductase
LKISIIVAAAENNVIGKDNKLIWHLPADMKFFKEKTTGHTVITGRKNYESIPEKFRPLPNRTNIIITRQPDYKAPGVIVVGSIYEATEAAKLTGDKESFIIGGADIYKQTLDITDTVYLTRVHHRFDGDVFFPELPVDIWVCSEKHEHPADDKNPYGFTIETYIRK